MDFPNAVRFQVAQCNECPKKQTPGGPRIPRGPRGQVVHGIWEDEQLHVPDVQHPLSMVPRMRKSLRTHDFWRFFMYEGMGLISASDAFCFPMKLQPQRRLGIRSCE